MGLSKKKQQQSSDDDVAPDDPEAMIKLGGLAYEAGDLRSHGQESDGEVPDDLLVLAMEMVYDAPKLVGISRSDEETVVEWLVSLCDTEHAGLSLELCTAVARAVVRRAIGQQITAQGAWAEATDCDQLDSAFAELRAEGFATNEGEACCSNCAHGDLIGEVLEDDAKEAYAFYHAQDLWEMEPGDDSHLLVGYGSASDNDSDIAEVGQRVAAAFSRHDLVVDWDGSPDRRIGVHLLWQRRWTSEPMDSSDPPEVTELFERLAEAFDPEATFNLPEAMFNLGVLAKEAGDLDAARAWCEKAANLDHPDAMFRLGLLAYEEGDEDAARAWYEQAAKLDNPDAMFFLGLLAEEAGDMDVARVWYEQAAALGNTDAIEALLRELG